MMSNPAKIMRVEYALRDLEIAIEREADAPALKTAVAALRERIADLLSEGV